MRQSTLTDGLAPPARADEIDEAKTYATNNLQENSVTRVRVELQALCHEGEFDAAKAKLYATELEDRVTDHCVQLHGGAGYMDEYPVSRMYTAARVSRIYAGSSEIMREIVARSIGLDPRQKIKKSRQDAA